MSVDDRHAVGGDVHESLADGEELLVTVLRCTMISPGTTWVISGTCSG